MSGCDNFDFEAPQDEFGFMDGLRGADGTTFYPHVSAEGVLSWTNDGGKPNPAPVTIKGADGKSAYQAAVEAGFSGTEAEFNEYLSGIGDLTDEVADQKSAINSNLYSANINGSGIVEYAKSLNSVSADVETSLTVKTPQLYDTDGTAYNNKSYYIITLCAVELGKTYTVSLTAKEVSNERLGLYTTRSPLNTNSLSGNVDASGLQYAINGEMTFHVTSTINGYLVLRSPSHSISSVVDGDIMVVEGQTPLPFQPFYKKRYDLQIGETNLIGEYTPTPIAQITSIENLYYSEAEAVSNYRDQQRYIITLCPVESGKDYVCSLKIGNAIASERLGLYTTRSPLNTNSLSGNVDASGLQYVEQTGEMTFKITSTINGYLVLRSPAHAINSFNISEIVISDNSNSDVVVGYVFDAKNKIAAMDSSIDDYSDKISLIKKSVREDIDNKTLVFAVTADNHYNPLTDGGKNQIQYAYDYVRIAEELSVDFILNLGDLIDQGSSGAEATENPKRIFAITNAFSDTYLPFVYAIGHHEQYPYIGLVDGVSRYTFPTDKVVGLTERFTRYIKSNHAVNDTGSSSFYIDFDVCGIRLISLDSVSNTAAGYSTNVVSFLQSALNTSNKVVVVSHVPTRASANWRSESPVNGNLIEEALESFVTGGGTVLCHIHGHTHWDNIVKENGMSYPLISVCCAKVDKANTTSDATGVSGTPTSYNRTNDSYSAYCMDVFCVHADTGVVNMYRFGVGSNRTYSPT